MYKFSVMFSFFVSFRVFGISSFESMTSPMDNVKCYKINFQSVDQVCTDDLFGFFEKATFIRKDGVRCYLKLVDETSALDNYDQGYYYSIATFTARDPSAHLPLHFRYEPSGYDQLSYDTVALNRGKWIEDFNLVAKMQVESEQCINLKQAGFDN